MVAWLLRSGNPMYSLPVVLQRRTSSINYGIGRYTRKSCLCPSIHIQFTLLRILLALWQVQWPSAGKERRVAVQEDPGAAAFLSPGHRSLLLPGQSCVHGSDVVWPVSAKLHRSLRGGRGADPELQFHKWLQVQVSRSLADNRNSVTQIGD